MAAQITIVRDGKGLTDFVNFPWSIYKNDAMWVPPLKSEIKKVLSISNNPFWKHANRELFLALKDGKPVGRIAAIVNEAHNETHKDKVGFFGFFECENNLDTASSLIEAAKKWLKNRGMEIIRGPMNPSINDEIGFLLEGKPSPPVFMMPYNPHYYIELMEKCGLQKIRDLYAWYIDDSKNYPDKIYRIAEKALKRASAVIRPINLADFKTELGKIKKIYNSAWEKNWGAVAMTDEEFEHLAKDFKKIIFPELALMAEVCGEPVGFSLAVPDMNQVLKKLNGSLLPFGFLSLIGWRKKITNIRIIIMGVIEEYRGRGIETGFYTETYKRATGMGIKSAEMGWILEDNRLMNTALEKLGSDLYKKYRVYETSIR